MISLKLAFRSVFRRPQQNLAVILGIALGVSLFVGVQVGGDSLNAGLLQLNIHAIGERDATISPTATPFFLTTSIISEELNPQAVSSPSVITQLRQNTSLTEVQAFSERLNLQVTALQPDTGSIEVGKRLTGIDINQDSSFGHLYELNGTEIEISDLGNHEIYIGENAAKDLFGAGVDPRGQNLTVQTTLFSMAQPQLNITSISVPFNVNLTIADVFADRGLGREQLSDYMISPLGSLQKMVVSAYNQVKAEAALKGKAVLGYGSSPISSIYIKWKDGIKIGEESGAAAMKVRSALESIVGSGLIDFYSVDDTRANIQDSLRSATDGLELLLNGFGAIIILAGVLVIINIQFMALAARERETGILRAIGANRGQIVRANLIESIFLGVFGSVLGLGGGILYGRLLVAFLGIAFQFPTGDVPTVVRQQTLIYSFLAGFFLSQITGLFPAIKASRVNIARVLRGIDAPEKEEFGKKSLYFGIILTIIAIGGILTLSPNPIFDGVEAFKNIDDVQHAYLPIVLIIAGPALLIAYYKSERLGLTVVGLFLLGFAYFNIFWVMDQIETGSGGLNYIIYLVASLLIGTVIIMAVNLGGLASVGQRITSWLARSRETPIRGTTMVAFRKMRSNVTRSTLTFALFATILTLNIWIGTFSYSFRYGVDSQVFALTGGSDMVMYSPDNAVPQTINLPQKLLDEFGQSSGNSPYVTTLKSFTVTSGNPYYQNASDPTSLRNFRAVSIANDSLWSTSSQDNWIFAFDLADNKTGTPFEQSKDVKGDPAATPEDEAVWKAVANNGTIPNKDGEQRPVLISSLIFDFTGTSFKVTKRQGDSVFLNLTDGGLQEFVIGAFSNGNPLGDIQLSAPQGPPGLVPTMYISDYWKDKLDAFSGFVGDENAYLGKTSEDNVNSAKIPPLLQRIEKWANAGKFEQNNGLYGLIAVSSYSIYEAQLEGQYRFFQFLQAFVSLGFAVGILGLLVVASRSVAERKREIGMLRALGFRRRDVVVSVVLELIVMGMIGLFIGFVNGTVMGYALTQVQSGTQFLIPWGLVALYGIITLFSAILAAIFPAIIASQIPPSDALRYTG